MVTPELLQIAQQARQAAQRLATLDTAAKNQALAAVIQSLEAHQAAILQANQADMERSQQAGLPAALLQRLKLSADKLASNIKGVQDVMHLPDPVGQRQLHRELDEGLILERVTCPLGVLGVVFEARPEAVIQISALALKSGNAVILKGGQEATESCQVLVQAIQEGLQQTQVPPTAVQLLTTRAEIQQLLELDEYVNLLIPRGSNAFVRYIQEHSRIPVLGHAEGICHLYVDRQVDIPQAIALAVDSKTQYPAACNAIETLLVHRDIAPAFLPPCAEALTAKGVKLRGDAATQQIIPVAPATEEDWRTEYLDLILAIRVVDSLEEAIAHINTYGSGHTEAIATTDPQAAAQFMAQVDAAGVYHNCSTRFADGFRYGFGAEVGISTQRLPPRGPVGLEGLVTYKYRLWGQGHVVATYSGPQAKSFTHRDLPL
ncbi:MAG: glutamate-5-semialdehyde dehydrogenase [Gloeomargarita sp. SKYBB_i_bin120]|nr:glutamate-5-semialdehyde dehydrogenase [Gloeomargarita sp. SKYG98]MCS7293415.1 glutamate-5-semialdehyde dehydrogenase [Gloeomargarita sp. SKYB120]MDW8178981.1 glutamate-5-semialdehyde dehydrogenase [Gloeomargarita sp. SKYBB_i_bin120]